MNFSETRVAAPRLSFLERFCWGVLREKLVELNYGYLNIHFNGEDYRYGDETAPRELRCRIVLHDPRAITQIAFGGSIGTGESFAKGYWTTAELTALVRIFVKNRDILNRLDSGVGALFTPLLKLSHFFRRNKLGTATENIKAHYDLGNDFFELFLSPTMLYSSAFFKTPDQSIDEAQIEKIDRICRHLQFKPGLTVLEIGSGWGTFAIHAAKNYGVHVTTVTISQRQYDYAREKIKAAGLESLIDLRFQDYRLTEGKFDRVVSIEMIEAVGLRYLDEYFNRCSARLKDDGLLCIQSILIADQFYDQAAKTVDFIQTHIFPGSAIPSAARILRAIKTQTDLNLSAYEAFGHDYAKTLEIWSAKLTARHDEMRGLGYSQELYLLWLYYFHYCAGGFYEKSINVAQWIFSKPGATQDIRL